MRKPLAHLDETDTEAFRKLVLEKHVGHCGTCRYFEPFEEPTWPSDESFKSLDSFGMEVNLGFAQWSGCCHRYPPKSYSEHGEVYFGFSEVEYRDWCGEWKGGEIQV